VRREEAAGTVPEEPARSAYAQRRQTPAAQTNSAEKSCPPAAAAKSPQTPRHAPNEPQPPAGKPAQSRSRLPQPEPIPAVVASASSASFLSPKYSSLQFSGTHHRGLRRPLPVQPRAPIRCVAGGALTSPPRPRPAALPHTAPAPPRAPSQSPSHTSPESHRTPDCRSPPHSASTACRRDA